ncbi:cache domain-containing protein, partial [Lysobacter xanthus]
MSSSRTSTQGPGATVEPPPSRRRMPLLAMGWGLVALLPVIAAVLVVTEYDEYQAAREQRSRLIADAVQRQALDRLYLVGRQLEGAAAAPGGVVPMSDVTARPAAKGDAPAVAPLHVGVPVQAGGRWMLPVSRRIGDRLVQARIDAGLLSEVVKGYRLGDTEFVSLVQDDGHLVAGSFDSDRAAGQSMTASPLFSPRYRDQTEGRYRSKTISDGRVREHAFRRLPGTGLTIVVGTEPPRVVDLWARPAAAIVLIALAMAFAWG